MKTFRLDIYLIVGKENIRKEKGEKKFMRKELYQHIGLLYMIPKKPRNNEKFRFSMCTINKNHGLLNG